MALIPSRLLLPVRVREPSPALSSASSRGGGNASSCSQFSLLHFRPRPTTCTPISASLLEVEEGSHSLQHPYGRGDYAQLREYDHARRREHPPFDHGRGDDGEGLPEDGYDQVDVNAHRPRTHRFVPPYNGGRTASSLALNGGRSAQSQLRQTGVHRGAGGGVIGGARENDRPRSSNLPGQSQRDFKGEVYGMRVGNTHTSRNSPQMPWVRFGHNPQSQFGKPGAEYRVVDREEGRRTWKDNRETVRVSQRHYERSWRKEPNWMETGNMEPPRNMPKTPWTPQRRYGRLENLVSREGIDKPPGSVSTWSKMEVNTYHTPWELERPHTTTEEGNGTGRSGREEVQEERGSSAIAQIVQKLRGIRENDTITEQLKSPHRSFSKTAQSLSLPRARDYLHDKSAVLRQESVLEPALDTRFPWEIEGTSMQEDAAKEQRVIPPTLAELTIPGFELKRLRTLARHVKEYVKIDKKGVSDAIAKGIKQRWCSCELVRVKCEGMLAANMKKTVEELERKTGGLVIWKAGSVVVLYRGKDFGQPVSEIAESFLEKKLDSLLAADDKKTPTMELLMKPNQSEETPDVGPLEDTGEPKPSMDGSQKSKRSRFEPKDRGEYEAEVEEILKHFGPRYEDWTGQEPIPVDADLLAEQIPDYRPPYRLLPYGVKPKISNTDATRLRRLSRPLSPHFVIGRNSVSEGLAAAVVELWEKSEIAKVGLKKTVLNTSQERIAEDLKRLTGGVLLSRDKQSMTFYRGNDFLPKQLAASLSEREGVGQTLQEEEERVRSDRSIAVQYGQRALDVEPSWVRLLDVDEQIRLKQEAARSRWLQMVQRVEMKINTILKKKEKAETELAKVEKVLKPAGQPADRETITEEERFMFKKLGLRMGAFLLVGRRGVFSGVVQNMHLHWKHRELVKLIIKIRDPIELEHTAKMLEYESGGVLVAIEPTSKGQAVIMYRGKNYKRPPELRPANLLTKRLALKRSIEIQRCQTLTRNIAVLERQLVYMKSGLSKMNQDRPAEVGIYDEGSGRVKPEVEKCDHQQGDSSDMVESEAEGGMTNETPHLDKGKLRSLSCLGPIFEAEPLTKRKRHELRKEALSLRKSPAFLVGITHPLSAIARAIRVHFVDHALVKIGVKGRPAGLSVQDVVQELEDLTGGTLYYQGTKNIILYRGWQSREEMPTSDLYDVLSPEQCDALEQGQSFWNDALAVDDCITPYENDASDTDNEEDEVEDCITDILSDGDVDEAGKDTEDGPFSGMMSDDQEGYNEDEDYMTRNDTSDDEEGGGKFEHHFVEEDSTDYEEGEDEDDHYIAGMFSDDNKFSNDRFLRGAVSIYSHLLVLDARKLRLLLQLLRDGLSTCSQLCCFRCQKMEAPVAVVERCSVHLQSACSCSCQKI